MTTRVFLVFALIVGGAAGCGDDGGNPPAFPDGATNDAQVNDGSVTDASTNPTADATPASDGAMDADGPMITVVSPTDPGGDLSSGAIVTSYRFTVRCRVEENMAPVDTSSITVTAIVDGVETSAPAAATLVPHEYAGDVVVSNLNNGKMVVRCTAGDTAGRLNSEDVSTYLDLGPKVQVLSPLANTSYANQVSVVFTVTSAPVTSSDPGGDADFDNVTATVGGVDVTSLLNHDGNGTFNGDIKFDDPLFDPTLDGPQTLVIRAPNKRTTTAVVRKSTTAFTADELGPTITLLDPSPGDLVSGIVSFEVTVTDSAGVDESSVIGTVAGGGEFSFTNTGGDTYQGLFDTRQLGLGMVFPNVVIRAKDLVGNQSSTGFVIALDNRAPLASLDPPRMRERKFSELQGGFECSEPFDPLGPEAADDGEVVPQLFRLNVRAEDRGNVALSNPGTLIPQGGIAADGVKLFVLDDTSKALIVDTDGDGVCDSINPLLTPTSVPTASNEAAVINMAQLTEVGGNFYRLPPPTGMQPDYNLPFYYAADPEMNGCGVGDPYDTAQIVDPACELQSSATRIIELEMSNDSAIWGIPPFDSVQCWGNSFDAVASNISDGWACMAVQSVDNLGNLAISPPLRLCIDHDGDRRDNAGTDLYSLGCGETPNIRPAQIGAVDVGGAASYVVAGGSHTCVSLSGSVRCWGEAGSGQLGYGNTTDVTDPAAAGTVLSNVIALSAGDEHTCAINSSNAVYCWGNGGNGRLGHGNTNTIGDDETAASAGLVTTGVTAEEISAGGRHTCVRAGTAVRCWGDNSSGQLGRGDTNDIGDNETPDSISNVSVGASVAQVAAGGSHTCVLTTTGQVRCWGDNTYGQLGYGNTDTIGDNELPSSAGTVDVTHSSGVTVTQITAGDTHTCALLSDGNVVCWGNGADGRLGYGSEDNVGDDEDPWIFGNVAITDTSLYPIVEIAAGHDHTCARDTRGLVWCWGAGFKDQLGYARPMRVGHRGAPAAARFVDTVGSPINQLAPGGDHTCVRSGTAVLCWGSNASGQVGPDKGDHISNIGDIAPVWRRPSCTGTYNPMTNTTDPNTPCRIPESFQDDPRWQLRRSDLGL